MSIIVFFRDSLNQIIPVLYRNRELFEQDHIGFWKSFLQSFAILLESTLPSIFFYLVSFQWRRELFYFPTIRPDLQIARADLGIFSATPIFPTDPFPISLNLPVSINIRIPTLAFQHGFLSSFFLTFPASFFLIVHIRRYWVQGFVPGLICHVGYRAGETIILFIVAKAFRPLWLIIGSPYLLRFGWFLTRFILWESSLPHDSFYSKSLFSNTQNRVFSAWFQSKNAKRIFEWFWQNQYLLFLFILHFLYAWSEQTTFFGSFISQALNSQSFSNTLFYFSQGSIVSFSYRTGLFFGGLFFDLCFGARSLIRIEQILLRLRCPPLDWKQKFHTWTSCLIIAFSFSSIPYYRADYVVFSPLGFFGRDVELKRRVAQIAFDYSVVPGKALSILFEGRNVIGEDNYGRPSPDILRKTWQMRRPPIEISRDFVDETYRTQQTNQRVDRVYLGTLEQKILDWLVIRTPKNSFLTDYDKKKTR
jgi:hypothetical protein